jgi:decaprenylphospho-beta-D-ribofuranose 2-oxidase
MKLSGWGRYPVREAELVSPSSIAGWRDELRAGSLCIRGMGRSYGDSSIAPRVAETRLLDRFIDFDHEQGVIACGEGAVYVPRFWALVMWFIRAVPNRLFDRLPLC